MHAKNAVTAAEEAISRTHREEWARIVAGLVRRFGDLDIAEEMAAEAFAAAFERWKTEGVPPNPGGWITTTANRKAIDWFRREARREAKHVQAFLINDPEPPSPLGVLEDDRLRLVFSCCHPALPLDARVALTLRIIGGLTVPEIAHAFLVRETTMGQRISRAKEKIRTSRIPYRIPVAEDLPARIDGVLAVLYLIFNEGYFASAPDTPPIRRELTGEAIRLTRLVHALLPEEGEVAGLLALMLLTEARTPARLSIEGDLVRLDAQDRGSWDRNLIAEGLAIIGQTQKSLQLKQTPPGRYLLTAEINAVHDTAPNADNTDWSQIVDLYNQLERLDPGPIVTLNKAIAISELNSPEVALTIVDSLKVRLDGYHAFHATRAELLHTLKPTESRTAYDRAIALATNTAEIAHLIRRRDQLAPTPVPGTPGMTTNGETA
ncbi:sigma-70 family RNA polymerase sigma factor [Paenarthrobacter sp. 4246]|uniref:RNA polymerase sigma factor n=1 Tax=Paenarthrobacter sp. 4246 TaxID=3156456 RepID=UPI003393A918